MPRFLLCVLLPLFLLGAAPAAMAAALQGWVVAVVDGDTLTVRDERKQQHRVRLAGVDAPEAGQPFGEQARQRVEGLLMGRPVNIFWFGKEADGRKIGVVYVPMPAREACAAPCSLNVGLTLVEEGLAWRNPADQKRKLPILHAQYREQELEARVARAGLWADAAPVAPWLWRKRVR
jgi:endonuclease YncB( thermonuclease family)